MGIRVQASVSKGGIQVPGGKGEGRLEDLGDNQEGAQETEAEKELSQENFHRQS